MAPIYVLNLTANAGPPAKTIGLAPCLSERAKAVQSLVTLPNDGPAIVYVLGHSVPNGLRIDPSNVLFSEADVAAQLICARQESPTLLIVDACFADSFRIIPGFAWPATFGLIFSCLAHERTWHDGEAKPISIFSQELCKAIESCRSSGDFSAFATTLAGAFDGLQTPVVKASPRLLQQMF